MLIDNLPPGIHIDKEGVCCEGFFCRFEEEEQVESNPLSTSKNKIGLPYIIIIYQDIEKAFSKPLKFGDNDQIKALKAYQAWTIRDELLDGDYSIFGV